MIRLRLAGPHTQILSSLCAACPHASAGCCVGPPEVGWSDIGRVVALGGRDWLLEEIAAKRLQPHVRGLTIRRVKARARADGPRVAKCVYHGPRGCTIPAERRSATCNYYVCESALDEGGDVRTAHDVAEAERARAAHAALARSFARWDGEMGARVAAEWPDGPPFDAAFLDGLGAAFEALRAADGARDAEP